MERELVRSLPKAVLHDHLDGGLRVGTILELADAAGYTGLPAATEDGLAEWFHQGESGSLVEYLAAFDQAVAVMQTPEALSRIAYECLLDHAAENVVYAEIRFAPELHQQQGLELDAVVSAVTSGLRRGEAEATSPIVVNVILCAMRPGVRQVLDKIGVLEVIAADCIVADRGAAVRAAAERLAVLKP